MSIAGLASSVVVMIAGAAFLVHSFAFPASKDIIRGERLIGVVLIGTALVIVAITLAA